MSRRPAPRAEVPRVSLARGPRADKVNHFRYFAQRRDSLRWMLATRWCAPTTPIGWLLARSTQARKQEPSWRSGVRRSAAPRRRPRRGPSSVVIPGTMGSELSAVRRQPGLAQLLGRCCAAASADIDAGARPTCKPVDLLDDFYGPLLEHLARDPPRRDPALRLAPARCATAAQERWRHASSKSLLPLAERTGQPLHIVAHSMGGLVARAMIADRRRRGHRGVGTHVCKLAGGSRLLMLGTPNRGSHEAVRWLTGFNPTQAKLSLLDLKHGVNGIIDIVRRYPGHGRAAALRRTGRRAQPVRRQVPTWKQPEEGQLGAGFGARRREPRCKRGRPPPGALLKKRRTRPRAHMRLRGRLPACHRGGPRAGTRTATPNTASPHKRIAVAGHAPRATAPSAWASGRLPEGVPVFYRRGHRPRRALQPTPDDRQASSAATSTCW